MSDETNRPAATPETDKTALAAAMLAVRELGDDVGRVKRQVRSLWITVIITVAVVVVLAVFTLLPRLFGVSVLGGGGFRGQNGQRFSPPSGQTGQPGANPQAPQGTTPSQ